MNDKIGIYNHNTGEQVIREMTDEEQAVYNAHRAIIETQKAEEKAKAEALRQSKIAAYVKLGLTADEIEILLPTVKPLLSQTESSKIITNN